MKRLQPPLFVLPLLVSCLPAAAQEAVIPGDTDRDRTFTYLPR